MTIDYSRYIYKYMVKFIMPYCTKCPAIKSGFPRSGGYTLLLDSVGVEIEHYLDEKQLEQLYVRSDQ